MKVRIEIINLKFIVSEYKVSYDVIIIDGKTFSDIYQFHTDILSYTTIDTKITCKDYILDQVKARVNILENYFQLALKNNAKTLLDNINIGDAFCWMDLEIKE